MSKRHDKENQMLVIHNAKVITPQKIIEDGYVIIEGGKITYIGNGLAPRNCTSYNVRKKMIN